MNIIYRYYTEYNYILEQFLEDNSIKYSIQHYPNSRTYIMFNLSSQKPQLASILESYKIKPICSFLEFAKKEIEASPWLEIRGLKQKTCLTNNASSLEYSCTWKDAFGVEHALHEKQIGPLTIKKVPIIGNASLCHEDSGLAYIFTNNSVMTLVNEHNLKGINFIDVYLRNGKKCDNFYQIIPANIIIQSNIVTDGHEQYICKECGFKQYSFNETDILKVKLSALNSMNDMYMTERIWGEGQAFSRYLISNKFYKLLRDNHLSKSIKFIPVHII